MLKIIADDLGLHKSINDGIIFLLKQDKINGASLMANGVEFEDAVRQCLALNGSNIGVHLNLVEQESVINGSKMLRNHKIFFIKYILGLVSKSFIYKELKAQVEKVIKAGISPKFLNGNQHLHLLPGIMAITIKLAQEYKIPYIRIVNEPVVLKNGNLSRQLQLSFLNFLSKMAKNKIKRAGLQCNDIFVGFISAGNLRKEDINTAKILSKKFPESIVELGCHPGFENADLKIKFKHWGNYNWKNELELLEND